MTDDEAIKILNEGRTGAYIGWNNTTNSPDISYWGDGPSVCLDGDFEADELEAILHFLRKPKP